MRNTETLIHTLSFYGRLVDDLTRNIIPYKNFKVAVKDSKSMPLYKEDGYFVFSDIEPSNSAYEIKLTSMFYQSRTIQKKLPSVSPVELSYPGEDELYVFIKNVFVAEKKVTFTKIPFVKTIPIGSEVIGEGNFSSTLTEALEGKDVEFAILESVAGLSSGKILRIIRSHHVIMRPGPYYSFAPETTLLVLKLVEDNIDETPIADVKVEIEKLNATQIKTVQVGSMAIKKVTLPGPPVTNLILGSLHDITTYSNLRGDCVFYYPSDTPVTKLKLKMTRTGYIPKSEEISLVTNKRNFKTIKLKRV